MTALSTSIRQRSTGALALAALVLFVLFTATVLPAQAARAEAASGGVGSPDQSLLYTPADLYGWAEAYGAEGRSAYVRARLTFDVVWPLVYAFFLTTAIGWSLRRALPPESRWQLLNLVPLVGLLLDYVENLSAATVMARYPARTPLVEWLAPLATALKWLFVNGSFVILLAALLALLWRRCAAEN